VTLVGNKSDLMERRAVSVDEGVSFSKSESILFFETSALDASNVQEAFTTLITEVVKKLASKNPAPGTGPAAVLAVPAKRIVIDGDKNSKKDETIAGKCC
jgi:GTPase SAR1 family protein